jgi:uncharacterized caspase-like protein
MRPSVALRLVGAALAGWLLLSPAVAQDKRVALVIGNAHYKNAPEQKTRVNDATDAGAALARIGFAVTSLRNASGEEMRKALAAFGAKASLAEDAVVFYTGHGLQVAATNFLIPVDAEIGNVAD